MPKVMLAEDDRTMLSLMSTLLEMEGFQVVKYADEQTADDLLDTLRQSKPDLAMVDIHIRQINGLDVVRLMREDDGLKNVRVLMASGMAQDEECLAAGADSFILKPFMPDDLIKRIRALIDRT
ncbi:MAG: response regulator transcription factor [Chloroflexota bacterium]